LSANRLTFEDVEVYSLPKALEESIDFSKFKCEKQEFADYLRSTAPEDDKNNIAKVWVFTSREREVIGYVTLIMSQLSRSEHRGLGKLTTHRNVSAILMSEMAAHMDYAGRGLGRLMLDWVVSMALDLSQYVACRLVIVESLEDKVDVYKHWGFQSIYDLEDRTRYSMFLRIDSLTED
jgi:GNAT superfamily N-acetyltransferase